MTNHFVSFESKIIVRFVFFYQEVMECSPRAIKLCTTVLILKSTALSFNSIGVLSMSFAWQLSQFYTVDSR